MQGIAARRRAVKMYALSFVLIVGVLSAIGGYFGLLCMDTTAPNAEAGRIALAALFGVGSVTSFVALITGFASI